MADLPQSCILRISDEKTLELIDLYEKEECLWNTKLEEYKMRDRRMKAAERIAKKLNLKSFEGKHVMIKFKNLRNSYSQELKKIAHSLNSAEEVYRPRVCWFNKMDSFLRPHLQLSRSHSFMYQQDELFNKQGSIGEENSVKIKVEVSDCMEDTKESLQMSEPENVPDEACHPSASEDDTRLKPTTTKRLINSGLVKKRKKEEVHSCSEPTPCKILNSMVCTTQLEAFSRYHEDSYDTFGKYIASMLRSMPAERALELQPKIVSLVTLAASEGEARVSQSDGND